MTDAQAVRTLSLLIVDDDDVDREKLRRMLAASALQAKTTEAGSGMAALKALRQARFDCVLLDYQLGDGIATDFVPQMNAASGGRCPIILITGLGNEMVAVQAMREGICDYLSKHSLSPELLHDTVDTCLRRLNLEEELKTSQERLKWLGLYDSLTGLPNRNLLFDRLEQATHSVQRGSASFALLMIDLDLFKEVNDTLGHEAGDRVLAEVGLRLHRMARVSDTYGRIGGDEFAGILLGTQSTEGACTVAQTLTKAIKEPIDIGGTSVTVGASIGIALAPQHGRNGHELLAQADMAMYSAKRGSRGFEIASGGGRDPSDISPVVIASEIAGAIKRNELFLNFQPKVCLRSGKLVGLEALVRWNKPGVGQIPPGRFIPAIERTAVILPVTMAILDLALDQLRNWVDQGWQIPISVNISARMLDDQDLTPLITRALSRRNLPPELLTLEVTETSLMANPDRAKKVLAALSAAGISISIDDFGSGFTSLMLLRELDIDEIKLDKAFVDGLGHEGRDESIVRSVATLSDGFHIGLVAEGIERRESVRVLKDLGCTIGQGYSIARPMSADAFADWWPSWRVRDEKAFAA